MSIVPRIIGNHTEGFVGSQIAPMDSRNRRCFACAVANIFDAPYKFEISINALPSAPLPPITKILKPGGSADSSGGGSL
eukprot:CAMPEP_0194397196 /NCGR_PEP_ID=MMETSP0174-20130528/125413_1 /TAXON_ID=216777 /ORGANISM="Proboscia alata, Strain PI-D3" /LENGTH=78 /DNA_ID=CAMNT_0039193355 /DNA_START=1141 /DNA_END=1377 /DNA_ORIENTATION=-